MSFWKRLTGPPSPPLALTPGEVEVVLVDPGDHKIQVIKVVREATGLPLKDSKALVDKAPSGVGRYTAAAAADLV